MAIIVIDPGHGGTADIGGSGANHATGPAGTKEKTLTLDIGQRLAALIAAAGHVPVLTRDGDVNLGLAARAEVARSHKADVFLSIHFNGDAKPKTQGTETWLHSIHSDDSALLAEVVQARLVTATKHRDRNGGHKKEMDLGVLNLNRHWAGTACCLAEISFLTDPAEEQRLQDDAYRDAIAAALRNAVVDFVGRRTHALAVAFGLPERWEAVATNIGMAAATAPTDAERQREAELWAVQAPLVDLALAFWNGFLGLRMGAATGQPLDDAALRRLRHIIRAVSWVESKHGTAGTVQPERDPMQCGNPADTWWKELTAQLAEQDRFVRGPGLQPNYWAKELPAAVAKDSGFSSTAALAVLGDAAKGHKDAKFTREHSYWWGIPYLIHRINTQADAKTYQCGDLSRARLVNGAVTYNGTPEKPGDKKYAEKLADALALIGDLPAPMALVASASLGDAMAVVSIPKPLDPVTDVARITAAVAPDCSLRLLATALAKARTEILVYVYNLSARHIARALNDAIDRGVAVTLMYDTNDKQSGVEQKLIDELQDAGARVQAAPSSGAHRVFTVCHQKFAVVDGNILVVGSANWASSAFPQANAGEFMKGNREWLVRIDDRRVAGIFIDLFWRDWALATTPMLAAPFPAVAEAKPGIPVPTALARPDEHQFFDLLAVTDDRAEVTPLLSPDNYFDRTLELIRSAKTSIGVEQQYILGEEAQVAALLEALKARSDDGISVRIVAAPTYRRYWERTLESLRRAGLDDHLRAINLNIFTHCHNKGVVVDGEAVIVSSTNWSGNSINSARETGVLIRSPRIAGYFAAALANDYLTGLKPDEVDTALAGLAAAMFDPDGFVMLPGADFT